MTGDYSRAEWARYDARWGMWPPTSVTALDPLRAPDTDEEPWDVLDAAIVGTAAWATATTVVVGLLSVVLVALGCYWIVRRNRA